MLVVMSDMPNMGQDPTQASTPPPLAQTVAAQLQAAGIGPTARPMVPAAEQPAKPFPLLPVLLGVGALGAAAPYIFFMQKDSRHESEYGGSAGIQDEYARRRRERELDDLARMEVSSRRSDEAVRDFYDRHPRGPQIKDDELSNTLAGEDADLLDPEEARWSRRASSRRSCSRRSPRRSRRRCRRACRRRARTRPGAC
jgi:hypothetical protein